MNETEKTSGKTPWIPLLLFLIASYMAGFIGSFATNAGLEFWYQTLQKPSFNPPSWVFAPVWTTLYFLMGWSAWMVWCSPPSRARSLGLTVFFVQLALNALWPWMFFYWHMLMPAFVEIVLLTLVAAWTAWLFGRVRATAGWAWLPILGWLLFASALNYTIWRLNS